ncbi:MAG: NFACT family protein [Candidatus Micrarchaeia archaeon]|jgi:predicted ribosome quality control (RQC) complex YloA/Tae2 family protein
MENKREMTSFEYTFIIKELQALIGKKVNKIYELDENIFRFKIKGEDLIIELGKRMHLTKFIDQAPEKPSNFTMFLRKKFNNATITKIYQYNTDRVFIIELETKENKYKIILEMFSKGNLIILDEENKIISPYHREDWKDRIIRRNEKYLFPKTESFPLTPKLSELEKLLNEKYIIVCLSKLPLGTIYIKQILKEVKINEKKQGNLLTSEEKKKIIKSIEELVNNASPHAIIENEEIIDFSLYNSSKKFDTLNEILDKYYCSLKEEIEEESNEIKKLKNRLKKQEEHQAELKKQEEIYKKNGDLIYEKYSQLEKVVNWVRSKIEEKKWDEIEEELKKINAKIDKKTKEIEIKL